MAWNLGLGLVSPTIMLFLSVYLNRRIKKSDEVNARKIKAESERIDCEKVRNEATQNGVQALLRSALVSSYERAIERAYAPIYERENVEKMFVEYKKLGGNGTIDHLVDELRDLPVQKPLPKPRSRAKKTTAEDI